MNIESIIKNLNSTELTKKEKEKIKLLLSDDPNLANKLFLQLEIVSAIHDYGRKNIKERFKKLEVEKQKVSLIPEISRGDKALRLVKKAAFMHNTEVSSSSLPISEDTINDFLSDNSIENVLGDD